MQLRPSYFLLPEASFFRIAGRDAQRYLNARLSNDIKNLSPGSLCIAAMLTAQGKTEGLFVALSEADSSYTLISEAGERSVMETALKRFIVSDRVTVTDFEAPHSVLHVVAEPEILLTAGYPLPPHRQCILKNHHRLYTFQRSPLQGVDVLLPSSHVTQVCADLLSSGFAALGDSERELWRIRGGHPKYPRELNPETLFPEADFLSAVSFTKGCYVGQEVVEKVAAIGKLSRKLYRMKLTGPLAHGLLEPQLEVRGPDGTIVGSVISFAFDPMVGQTFAFATLRNGPSLTKGARVSVGTLEGELL